MTPSDLLQSINLSEYLSVFSENELDEGSLRMLSDEDLKELGVAKLCHRKKILDAIVKIPASESRPSPLSGFIETFPNVVALPLREYLREENPVVRLWTMCYTIELLLRLFTVVLVAERRQADGSLPDDLARRLADTVEKPTMGIWFAMSQALISGGADKEGIGDPSAALISGGLKSFLYGPDKFKTPETSFLRLRNRLAHGAGMLRAEAERLLGIWQSPFERTVQEASWLADWELIGRDDAVEWRLLRGCDQHAPLIPPLEAPDCGDADAVWLRVCGKSLLLWPLALFGKPSLERVGKKAGHDHAQIYSSKEAACLTYTPLGCEELSESESGPGALAAFEALFRLNEHHKNAGNSSVLDFLHEIRIDASQMVGREEEIEQVKERIKDCPQGVLWMSGAAGMGKSFLMAKIATDLLDEASGTVILPYRFRAGDARCTRESLADFVEERLPVSLNENLEINAKAAERLDSILGGLKVGCRVILILDGLDEIARRDPGFAAEIPLKLNFPGVLWILAGRPEADLERVMREYAAERLFENGLPPMSAGDIRTMILNKIGPLRKNLLVQDHEQGEQVINPFIELVTKRAAGLPLYVKYVIGDVLAGKYRVLDAHEDLPASLHAYHENLLRRLGVGDLQGILTPLVACLAVAYEPLTLGEVDAVLRNGKVPVADSDAHSLVKRGLAAITAMVTSAPNFDGDNGFTLFHRSLRDHILQSKEISGFITQTKKNFAELAAASTLTEPLKHYLLRRGVRHLLDSGQNAAAEKLLLDIDHLAEISKAGIGDQEIYNYWREIGGQDRAAGYLESVPAFLQSAKEDNIKKVFIVTRVLMFASWFEIGIQVAKRLVDKYNELGMESASALNNLAVLLYTKGDLAGAEPLYRRALEVEEQALGHEHPSTLCSLNNLASLLQVKGNLPGAETLLRRVLEASERTLDPEHPDTLTCLSNLAMLLQTKGDLPGAETLSHRALEIQERTLGSEHPSTLTSLNNLGALLKAKGDFAGAETLLRRSLEAQERTLGPEHPNTLASLSNLASLLEIKGDFTGAETLYRRALEALEHTFGQEHPSTLTGLNNLAALLLDRRNLPEAESHFRRAFEAQERTLGPHHPDTLTSLSNLAILLQTKGDLAEAEPLCRRALEAMERTLGSEHPDTLGSLSNLANLLQAKGDLAEAEALCRRALEAMERTLGPEHSATLCSLNHLAFLLQTKGDYAGAEPLCRRALEALERTLGPEHSFTLTNRNNLAISLWHKGDYAGAETLLHRSLEARERTLGSEHPDTLSSLNHLASLLQAKKNQVTGKKGARHTPRKSKKRKKR